jgi:hypothetical protein
MRGTNNWLVMSLRVVVTALLSLFLTTVTQP